MEEQENELWERRDGEPMQWYARFLAFLNMGPGRSLLGTVKAEEAKKGKEKLSISPPGAWSVAAKQWEWRKRAEAWDEEQQRLAIASSKYSLISERVKLLDRWVDTQDGIMLSHVADHGYARADSLEQLRGLLDDIAKETGGRVKVTKQEMSGSLDIQGARESLLSRLKSIPVPRSSEDEE